MEWGFEGALRGVMVSQGCSCGLCFLFFSGVTVVVASISSLVHTGGGFY